MAASQDNKKSAFLKAFSRTGRIGTSAKAIHISRDAVHDWRRNDPCFAAAFLVAKSQAKNVELLAALDAVEFFFNVVEPWVASMHEARSAVSKAIYQKFKERPCHPPPVAPSRKTAATPLHLTSMDTQDFPLSNVVARRPIYIDEMAMH